MTTGLPQYGQAGTVGRRLAAKAAIGFGSTKREGDDVEAINRLFTPEFRNRLDAIIPFGSLPVPVIHQVVQKFVMQLEAQLSERGVTFDVTSGADPTVAMYMNDAPVETNFLFQSMFDIGQIEVLRGPQGTTRGVAAPSGAITLTTRKPNLSEIGGYGSVTVTDQHGRNVQGAINVPVIRDMLAVRVAGLLDQDDFDGVNSIHSGIAPRQVTSAVTPCPGRAS